MRGVAVEIAAMVQDQVLVRQMRLAVLADRGGRELPIEPAFSAARSSARGGCSQNEPTRQTRMRSSGLRPRAPAAGKRCNTCSTKAPTS